MGSAHSEQLIPSEISARESSKDEKQCSKELRLWLENEVDFIGRTDDEFLLIFIRGCKNSTEKAKKKITLYYENRKRVPQWWANRDINQLDEVIQLNAFTLVTDKDPALPCLTFFHMSRAKAESYDQLIKLGSIVAHMSLRRPNCQSNGVIYIIDAKEIPMWLITKYLNPNFVYNVVKAFIVALPFRVKGVYVINFPAIFQAGWQLMKPMLSKKMQERFCFYGSDWSDLKDAIDARLLPEEYGGENGSIDEHQQDFNKQLYSFSKYILDDNKYGFPNETSVKEAEVSRSKGQKDFVMANFPGYSCLDL